MVEGYITNIGDRNHQFRVDTQNLLVGTFKTRGASFYAIEVYQS